VGLRIGVIGGTGLYEWGPGEAVEIDTEFGPANATFHKSGQAEVVFLPRHGPRHDVPAHRVDSRVHVRAMKAARVDYVVGVFNTGTLSPSLKPSQWLVLDDLIDTTQARPRTFDEGPTVHVDFARPFCSQARKALVSSAPAQTLDHGVYATTQGPRFETAAEARLLRSWGADVAGMTAGPEAALAREAGLCYAGLAFVANGADEEGLRAQVIQRRLATAARALRAWVLRATSRLPVRKSCDCSTAPQRGTMGPSRVRA